MRFIYLLFIFSLFAFGAEVQTIKWAKGETFLTFLEKYQIPLKTYFDLSKTDQELCAEIGAGIKYDLLTDDKNKLVQALIPISDEMQINIKQVNNKYIIDFIPIISFEKSEILTFNLKKNPYDDIIALTNNYSLANEFVRNFKGSLSFRTMKNGDVIAIKYKQKVRNGQFFGSPDIDGVLVEVNKKKIFLYKSSDGNFYDDKGKTYEKFFMKIPISYKKITSRFTKMRFHPVLHIYRAHLGIDLAAEIGTRVFAASDGKVSFRGIKGGYGKAVIINHKNGYKTLYAHLSEYASKLSIGSTIKQGTLIAYSGNSGTSSGPHLHFGVYKNEKAVDPLMVIKAAKTIVKQKVLPQIDKLSAQIKKQLQESPINNASIIKLESFESKTMLKI